MAGNVGDKGAEEDEVENTAGNSKETSNTKELVTNNKITNHK